MLLVRRPFPCLWPMPEIIAPSGAFKPLLRLLAPTLERGPEALAEDPFVRTTNGPSPIGLQGGGTTPLGQGPPQAQKASCRWSTGENPISKPLSHPPLGNVDPPPVGTSLPPPRRSPSPVPRRTLDDGLQVGTSHLMQ